MLKCDIIIDWHIEESRILASMFEGLNEENAVEPGQTTATAPAQASTRGNSQRQQPATFKGHRLLRVITVVALLGLLLCSCATRPASSSIQPARRLPADLKMNKDAGRRNLIIVPVRLENGHELPFILDTGASDTCFDKSMEPMLGKRLGTDSSWHFGDKGEAGIYASPKLYLGDRLLQMPGSNVFTVDVQSVLSEMVFSEMGQVPVGVLGIDILEHYCIQLDFAANRIRFLDSDHADKRGWGKPFPLANFDNECPTLSENLVGGKAPGSLIDTGCDTDGWLQAALFEQWTNQAIAATNGLARSPDGLLGGEKYSDIDLQRLEEKLPASGDSHMKFNGIGLRFLARHLVTLDFPHRTMYLKQTSAGPLFLKREDLRPMGKSACRFLLNLKARGQLPGWSKTDESATNSAMFQCRDLHFATLDIAKKGDSSTYHYQVIRAAIDNSWKLKKAWRTDGDGKTIEEYPVQRS